VEIARSRAHSRPGASDSDDLAKGQRAKKREKKKKKKNQREEKKKEKKKREKKEEKKKEKKKGRRTRKRESSSLTLRSTRQVRCLQAVAQPWKFHYRHT